MLNYHNHVFNLAMQNYSLECTVCTLYSVQCTHLYNH